MRKATSVMFDVGDSSFGVPTEVDDPVLLHVVVNNMELWEQEICCLYMWFCLMPVIRNSTRDKVSCDRMADNADVDAAAIEAYDIFAQDTAQRNEDMNAGKICHMWKGLSPGEVRCMKRLQRQRTKQSEWSQREIQRKYVPQDGQWITIPPSFARSSMCMLLFLILHYIFWLEYPACCKCTLQVFAQQVLKRSAAEDGPIPIKLIRFTDKLNYWLLCQIWVFLIELWINSVLISVTSFNGSNTSGTSVPRNYCKYQCAFAVSDKLSRLMNTL